ncbi:MAG: L,D-transpeptidase [Anaerolineae bacterium]|nr:MAG: L,D-transpeptidase [Anaerolineae bacterium]
MSSSQYQQALHAARTALQNGERRTARRWAERAVAIAPQREEGWLLLAAVASPRASVTYLNRALRINPASQRARRGLIWALERLPAPASPAVLPSPATGGIQRTRALPVPGTVRPRLWWALLLGLAVLILGSLTPLLPSVIQAGKPVAHALAQVFATATPTPTATFTPTPTSTPTPTFTPTPTATSTPTATPTFTPTNTPTATNTATYTPTPVATATPLPPPTTPPPTTVPLLLPPGVEKGERWVDVDLTHQRAYAYQGKKLIRAFVVSTGVWQHPTVTGQYHIYVKYEAADMAGPGYYLPAVPYVMYFYKGYGLHGTYWHNNFGTPMSHGCVNFTIEDARWLFNWASVGTLVNIHY